MIDCNGICMGEKKALCAAGLQRCAGQPSDGCDKYTSEVIYNSESTALCDSMKEIFNTCL